MKDGAEAALDFEASHGTPFLFVPVFIGLGAVGYFIHPSEPALTPVLFSVAVLAIFWRYRLAMGKRGWFAGALLCACLGILFAKIETARVQSTMLGGGVTATIEMRVLRVDRDGRQIRILGDILATRAPQLKYQPSRIRVSLPAARGNFAAGDVISGRFGLRPPGGPVRPGSYDFAFHAYFAGVGASGFAMGPVTRIESQPPSVRQSVKFTLENLRAAIATKVRAAIPGTSGNVAAALIAGVSGGIDPENEEALRVTGLAHVLSISGLHMALVAGAVLFLVRFGFALFPVFASRYPVKKWAAAAALVASFLYLLLSGGAVATLRAFIMLAVMLGAVMIDRQALTLRNLAIAAIIILVITPHEIMGPSFQMSFAATAALISAYGWVSRRSEAVTSPVSLGRWPMIRAMLLGAILTPVVAGLATAIFSAWHFHRLAPMGLPANLAAMPVISFVIMPFAMIGTFAMAFGLEEWPLRIMGQGVDAMLWIARWCADFSPQDTVGALAPAAFVLMILSLLVLTFCQSPIRLAALALIPAALLINRNAPSPDMLVSEDGRLVAIAGEGGALAVNRDRPNAFTTEVWRNAVAAQIVAKPEMPMASVSAQRGTGEAAAMETAMPSVSIPALISAAGQAPNRFACGPGICIGLAGNGALVAWLDPAAHGALDISGAENAIEPTGNRIKADKQAGSGESPDRAFARLFFETCAQVDLVITASAMPYRGCGRSKAELIRASDLARKGAAEIRFAKPEASGSGTPGAERTGHSGNQLQVTVEYAIGDPVRPWNRERVFSRAARNIPEFRRTATVKSPEAKADLPATQHRPVTDAGTNDE